MDITLMRIAATVASFVIFIAITIWACSGRNRQRFEEAANLPFEQD